MKTRWLGVLALAGVCGCSSSAPSSGGKTSDLGIPAGGGAGAVGGGGSGASAATAGSPSGASVSGTSDVTDGSDGGGSAPSQAGPGILTAGLWDDSLNFDFFSGYLASHQGITGAPGFSTSDFETAHQAFAQRGPRASVDIALVLDTTGSMGDELSYLTTEFANIWSAIQAALPNTSQRWALVVYRDTSDFDPGDAYVVKSFDFTDNAQNFAATIGSQMAGGGGDDPESPELGLEQLPTLTWRTDASVARVAFWVADAAHHDERAPAMKQAILDTLATNIHLYPVAASGTNDLLELTMRSAAEITGGRYLFLTDDSGVGDTHKLPEIPCYFVTKLARAIVRAVAMEVSGAHIGPDPADVIRTVGDPSSDGRCTTGDGQVVQLF